jgi:hypothetical protein
MLLAPRAGDESRAVNPDLEVVAGLPARAAVAVQPEVARAPRVVDRAGRPLTSRPPPSNTHQRSALCLNVCTTGSASHNTSVHITQHAISILPTTKRV